MKRFPIIVKMFSMVLVSGLLFTSCTGPSVVVAPPNPGSVPDKGDFLAGAAETDITPPPGLPVFGFSVMGESHTKGYWTRLKSRAIVFQYKNRPGAASKRFAIIQLDWGAVSALVYWKVAEKIAKFGFQPGDFLISATHTHAAPGGFFGVLFYNAFGSGQICLNCFFAPLVEWKTNQIAKSVELATKDLKPAVIGAGDVLIPGVSRNRSIEAWMMNWKENPLDIPYKKVLPRFHVLRIDHVADSGSTIPRAALIVAPVHANAGGQENIYYHADLFGIASRYMGVMVNKQFNLQNPIVVPVVPGPEGDVSPNYSEQGRAECHRLGKMIADNMFPVFNGLTGSLKAVQIDSDYVEKPLRNAVVGTDENGNPVTLASKPVIGAPVMGGTEDGRWDLYGSLGVFEGHTRYPKKGKKVLEHGVKIPLGGDIRFQEIFITAGLPDIASLQVIRFKDVITFATIPGEPTTETGRLIKEKLEKIESHENTAVIALANNYMSYTATCPEYQAQHFEGAFTLFGENQGRYFRQQLAKLAEGIRAGNTPESWKGKKRKFKPGSARKIFNLSKLVRMDTWEALKQDNGKKILTLSDECIIKKKDLRALDSEFLPVSFSWKGLKTGRMLDRLPKVWIEKNGEPFINSEGVLENDDWIHLIIRRKVGGRLWTAIWAPPNESDANASYQIKVECPDLDPLESDEFKLTKK